MFLCTTTKSVGLATTSSMLLIWACLIGLKAYNTISVEGLTYLIWLVTTLGLHASHD